MRYDELLREQERSAREKADVSYMAAYIFAVAILLVTAFAFLTLWPR